MPLTRRRADLDNHPARRDLEPTGEDVERFMDDFWRSPEMSDVQQWMPRVDVSENEREFRITADIPGVEPKDVNVEVMGNTLQISGQTSHESREETDRFYRIERQSGEFYRSFMLPANVDAEHIEAEVKRGTVSVAIPKTGETEPERRKVEVKNAEQRENEPEFSL